VAEILIFASVGNKFFIANASFAKLFNKHRQKRWQIVAANNLNFGM
jgi:hypothetical protein